MGCITHKMLLGVRVMKNTALSWKTKYDFLSPKKWLIKSISRPIQNTATVLQNLVVLHWPLWRLFLQTLSNLAHVNDLSECAGTVCMIQMTQLHAKVFSIGARGPLVMNLLEMPKVRLSYLADGAWWGDHAAAHPWLPLLPPSHCQLPARSKIMDDVCVGPPPAGCHPNCFIYRQ